ncbi:hypothetical protein HGRIS_005994 [Hohenbuehelia grisea]|uniref:Uncharacterized protein n=1 Tax=Hohenbuehelia grisea TaxID=104357 RepID=A0ABR3K120_9AGAR
MPHLNFHRRDKQRSLPPSAFMAGSVTKPIPIMPTPLGSPSNAGLALGGRYPGPPGSSLDSSRSMPGPPASLHDHEVAPYQVVAPSVSASSSSHRPVPQQVVDYAYRDAPTPEVHRAMPLPEAQAAPPAHVIRDAGHAHRHHHHHHHDDHNPSQSSHHDRPRPRAPRRRSSSVPHYRDLHAHHAHDAHSHSHSRALHRDRSPAMPTRHARSSSASPPQVHFRSASSSPVERTHYDTGTPSHAHSGYDYESRSGYGTRQVSSHVRGVPPVVARDVQAGAPPELRSIPQNIPEAVQQVKDLFRYSKCTGRKKALCVRFLRVHES